MLPSGPVLSTCRQTDTFRMLRRETTKNGENCKVCLLKVEWNEENYHDDRILTEVSSSGIECSENIIFCCQKHLFGTLYMCVKKGKANLAHILLPPEDHMKVPLGQQANAYISLLIKACIIAIIEKIPTKHDYHIYKTLHSVNGVKGWLSTLGEEHCLIHWSHWITCELMLCEIEIAVKFTSTAQISHYFVSDINSIVHPPPHTGW